MEYIIFPSELLNEVSKERLEELHLSPRKNIEGTKVVMKTIHFEALFPNEVIKLSNMLDDEDNTIQTIYPYDVYNSNQITKELSNNDWNNELIV